MTSNVNYNEYTTAICVCIYTYFVDVCSHPAAAEPPSNIRFKRDPPNATEITVTWTEPTTGANAVGYFILYKADDVELPQFVNSTNPMTTIIIDPTRLVYVITVITLSAMLPSKPSSPVIYNGEKHMPFA